MSEMNIYQRLNAVMKAVSYVQKEDKKVNNQYTFVSHDAVTAKVRPFLIEQGIVMMTDVKECRQDGNRTEAIVVLRFVNIDKPEDQVAITCFGYGIDPQDKGPGKAVSYAVKYGILKTLCLETGDDPERDNIEHMPMPTKVTKPKIMGEHEVDDCCLTMRECDELADLQSIFAAAYKRADAKAQQALKVVYDKKKSELIKETA